MKQLITQLKQNGKLGLYFMLISSAITSVIFLVIRMKIAGNWNYNFLAWNLFLAAIPLGISIVITNNRLLKTNSYLLVIGIFCWLVFFPNSPYIITDILHFRYNQSDHAWFDVMLLMMFSWTGLITGFVSLSEIQKALTEKYSSTMANIFVIFAIVLASFGVYIGRFLRWNSWDILRKPTALADDILHRLLFPFDHPRTYAVTFVIATFMTLAYFTLSRINFQSRKEIG